MVRYNREWRSYYVQLEKNTALSNIMILLGDLTNNPAVFTILSNYLPVVVSQAKISGDKLWIIAQLNGRAKMPGNNLN